MNLKEQLDYMISGKSIDETMYYELTKEIKDFFFYQKIENIKKGCVITGVLKKENKIDLINLWKSGEVVTLSLYFFESKSDEYPLSLKKVELGLSSIYQHIKRFLNRFKEEEGMKVEFESKEDSIIFKIIYE